MSYRKEEKRIQWKLRRIRAIVFAVVFFIVVAVCIFAAFVPPETWKYYFELPSVSDRKSGELRIHCLDVGQGDSTFIEFPDGKTMLIDGGNGTDESTTAIMRYLNALDVDYIDFVVLTHSDSDHCGGLDTVLTYKDVGTVYYPDVADATVNKEYASFFTALSGSSCKKDFNRRGLNIQSDNTDYAYQCKWIWPYSTSNPGAEPVESNAQSAVLWLTYGDNQALFMGDAPASVEETLCQQVADGWLDLIGVDITSIEWLKVSHHGSADGTTQAFLETINVKTAVISCGKDNVYGHPNAQVYERLTNQAESVYRTDKQGTILATWKSDGKSNIKTEK